MTILLSNDDGVEAPGLTALAECLVEFDDVLIAAPETEKSGVGHAITIREPIYVADLEERPRGVSRIAVRGTPADAVKFALRERLEDAPSLVVTGPNTGPNVGVNVFYSGTLGAAYEGVIGGVSAVAISSDLQRGTYNWKACLHFARQVVPVALELERERREHPQSHLRHGVARPFLWNLNVPALPKRKIRGLAITRHGTSGFDEFFVPHPEAGHYSIDGTFSSADPSDGYDASALLSGYASLTPLALDLTDTERFCVLREHFGHL